MKTVLYLVLAVVAFAGSIVGVLAATGNLSKEGWDKIVGKAFVLVWPPGRFNTL